jgi:hypothetical protein
MTDERKRRKYNNKLCICLEAVENEEKSALE